MKCRTSRTLFSRHLDGRLTDAERQALDAHLAGCTGCRAELAAWEVPARLLRAMGPAEAPGELAERSWRAAITAAAETRTPSFEERFVWAARRTAAAGALVAALVWGGLLWQEPAEIELASAPDAAELAMSLLTAEPASELAGEGHVDVE